MKKLQDNESEIASEELQRTAVMPGLTDLEATAPDISDKMCIRDSREPGAVGKHGKITNVRKRPRAVAQLAIDDTGRAVGTQGRARPTQLQVAIPPELKILGACYVRCV